MTNVTMTKKTLSLLAVLIVCAAALAAVAYAHSADYNDKVDPSDISPTENSKYIYFTGDGLSYQGEDVFAELEVKYGLTTTVHNADGTITVLSLPSYHVTDIWSEKDDVKTDSVTYSDGIVTVKLGSVVINNRGAEVENIYLSVDSITQKSRTDMDSILSEVVSASDIIFTDDSGSETNVFACPAGSSVTAYVLLKAAVEQDPDSTMFTNATTVDETHLEAQMEIPGFDIVLQALDPVEQALKVKSIEKQDKLSAAEIESFQEAAEQDSSVTVKVTSTADSSDSSVISGASVDLSSAALANLDSGKDAELVVRTVDKTTLTSEQQTAVGDATVFDIDLGDNHDFSVGNLTVTIPYELKAGETADNLVVFALLSDGTLESHTATYSVVDGKGYVTFTTSHLSVYGVTSSESYSASVLSNLKPVEGITMTYDYSGYILSSSITAVNDDGTVDYNAPWGSEIGVSFDYFKTVFRMAILSGYYDDFSLTFSDPVDTEYDSSLLGCVTAQKITVTGSPINGYHFVGNDSSSSVIGEYYLYNGTLIDIETSAYEITNDSGSSSSRIAGSCKLTSIVIAEKNQDVYYAGVLLKAGDIIGIADNIMTPRDCLWACRVISVEYGSAEIEKIHYHEGQLVSGDTEHLYWSPESGTGLGSTWAHFDDAGNLLLEDESWSYEVDKEEISINGIGTVISDIYYVYNEDKSHPYIEYYVYKGETVCVYQYGDYSEQSYGFYTESEITNMLKCRNGEIDGFDVTYRYNGSVLFTERYSGEYPDYGWECPDGYKAVKATMNGTTYTGGYSFYLTGDLYVDLDKLYKISFKTESGRIWEYSESYVAGETVDLSTLVNRSYKVIDESYLSPFQMPGHDIVVTIRTCAPYPTETDSDSNAMKMIADGDIGSGFAVVDSNGTGYLVKTVNDDGTYQVIKAEGTDWENGTSTTVKASVIQHNTDYALKASDTLTVDTFSTKVSGYDCDVYVLNGYEISPYYTAYVEYVVVQYHGIELSCTGGYAKNTSFETAMMNASMNIVNNTYTYYLISDDSGSTGSHNHVVVQDAAVEATCESVGLTAGTHCSECGKVISEQTIIPRINHDMIIKGTDIECSVCGLSDSSEKSIMTYDLISINGFALEIRGNGYDPDHMDGAWLLRIVKSVTYDGKVYGGQELIDLLDSDGFDIGKITEVTEEYSSYGTSVTEVVNTGDDVYSFDCSKALMGFSEMNNTLSVKTAGKYLWNGLNCNVTYIACDFIETPNADSTSSQVVSYEINYINGIPILVNYSEKDGKNTGLYSEVSKITGIFDGSNIYEDDSLTSYLSSETATDPLYLLINNYSIDSECRSYSNNSDIYGLSEYLEQYGLDSMKELFEQNPEEYSITESDGITVFKGEYAEEGFFVYYMYNGEIVETVFYGSDNLYCSISEIYGYTNKSAKDANGNTIEIDSSFELDSDVYVTMEPKVLVTITWKLEDGTRVNSEKVFLGNKMEFDSDDIAALDNGDCYRFLSVEGHELDETFKAETDLTVTVEKVNGAYVKYELGNDTVVFSQWYEVGEEAYLYYNVCTDFAYGDYPAFSYTAVSVTGGFTLPTSDEPCKTITMPKDNIIVTVTLNSNNDVTDSTVEKTSKVTADEIAQYKEQAASDPDLKVKITSTADGSDATVISGASVTLSSYALANLDSSKDAVLSVKTVDTSSLTSKQQAVVGDSTVFDIDLGDNHDFSSGNITLTIPYTLKSGETADNITVFALLSDNTLEEHPCTYTEVDGQGYVTFATSHLSVYGVMKSQTYAGNVLDNLKAVEGLTLTYSFGPYSLYNTVTAVNDDGTVDYVSMTGEGSTEFDDFKSQLIMIDMVFSADHLASYTDSLQGTITYNSPLLGEIEVSKYTRTYTLDEGYHLVGSDTTVLADAVTYYMYSGVLVYVNGSEDFEYTNDVDGSSSPSVLESELTSVSVKEKDQDYTVAGRPLKIGDCITTDSTERYIQWYKVTEDLGYGFIKCDHYCGSEKEDTDILSLRTVFESYHIVDGALYEMSDYTLVSKSTATVDVHGIGSLKADVYEARYNGNGEADTSDYSSITYYMVDGCEVKVVYTTDNGQVEALFGIYTESEMAELIASNGGQSGSGQGDGSDESDVKYPTNTESDSVAMAMIAEGNIQPGFATIYSTGKGYLITAVNGDGTYDVITATGTDWADGTPSPNTKPSMALLTTDYTTYASDTLTVSHSEVEIDGYACDLYVLNGYRVINDVYLFYDNYAVVKYHGSTLSATGGYLKGTESDIDTWKAGELTQIDHVYTYSYVENYADYISS